MCGSVPNRIHSVVERMQYVCVKNVVNIPWGLEVLLELFISSYSSCPQASLDIPCGFSSPYSFCSGEGQVLLVKEKAIQ